MDNQVIVTNIQRFSLSDGDGIRTTVFLKGCELRCPWCANPENQKKTIEEFYDYDKGKKGIYGYEISLNELHRELVKDLKYYNKGGGVTFSGGEPLLWVKELKPLLVRLKNEGINICFETSLYCSSDKVREVMNSTDSIIIDLKLLDGVKFHNVLGGSIGVFLDNVNILFDSFLKENITIRIPVSQEYVVENIELYLGFLRRFTPGKVEIFSLHSLGEKKYKTLGLFMQQYNAVSNNVLIHMRERISEICTVEILSC